MRPVNQVGWILSRNSFWIQEIFQLPVCYHPGISLPLPLLIPAFAAPALPYNSSSACGGTIGEPRCPSCVNQSKLATSGASDGPGQGTMIA